MRYVQSEGLLTDKKISYGRQTEIVGAVKRLKGKWSYYNYYVRVKSFC